MSILCINNTSITANTKEGSGRLQAPRAQDPDVVRATASGQADQTAGQSIRADIKATNESMTHNGANERHILIKFCLLLLTIIFCIYLYRFIIVMQTFIRL